MTWPLDVFESALADVWQFLRDERGEAESPREKFDRMARERLAGVNGGRSPWWPNESV